MVQALVEEGVEVVFGYPGGAIMPMYDALHVHGGALRHILARHEQGAAMAADGYARVTGRPGVCVATSGPGATNLVTGIAGAMLDSIPMVCITGQISGAFLGSDAFQETDIIGITAPITKWSYQITRAEEIPEVFAKAFHVARSGRPGPVLLDVAKDAQFASLDFRYRRRPPAPKPELDLDRVKEAARLLNEARRPCIFIGHGVLLSGAQKEVVALAEKTGIPVGSTLLGLSAFPPDHPLNAGMLGMHGNYGVNVLTNQADVILAVGMRFDDRVTGKLALYAKQAKVIHIEIDLAELDKNVRAAVALHADAKEALQELIRWVEPAKHSEWLTGFRHYDGLEFEAVVKNETTPAEGDIRMAEVVARLSEKTDGRAIVVSDVGQHQMAVARYYRFKRPNSHLSSGGLGAMGFGLPASIGAQLGAPDRQVVLIMGDGGFQMNIQELGVVAQERLPLKMILLNNGFLGMVRQWQEMFFEKRYSFTELSNPDFLKIAGAYGIAARRVAARAELAGALTEMLDADGPFLLEVVVEREANVFPMIAAGSAVDEMLLSMKP